MEAQIIAYLNLKISLFTGLVLIWSYRIIVRVSLADTAAAVGTGETY